MLDDRIDEMDEGYAPKEGYRSLAHEPKPTKSNEFKAVKHK